MFWVVGLMVTLTKVTNPNMPVILKEQTGPKRRLRMQFVNLFSAGVTNLGQDT